MKPYCIECSSPVFLSCDRCNWAICPNCQTNIKRLIVKGTNILCVSCFIYSFRVSKIMRNRFG